MKTKKGFTLIELLIVIGIIAVLMAIAVVAINPARQFAKANNARRWSDVNTILNAVSQNIIDGKGIWTCATGALPSSATNMSSGTGDYDICSCLVATYVGAMPIDPTATGAHYTDCTDYDTGYSILQTATGRVTVSAPSAQSENGSAPTISVTR